VRAKTKTRTRILELAHRRSQMVLCAKAKARIHPPFPSFA
jgi:hypothetical protein